MLVGIDFSLNSPALTIFDEKKGYTFVSLFNYGDKLWPPKKTTLAFKCHEDLMFLDNIEILPYTRNVTSHEHIIREQQKLIDASLLAKRITDVLIKYSPSLDYEKIAIEGFSYGSSGNSFIDIIQYNTILKLELINLFGANKLYVVPPSHAKKLTGKGNANKFAMLKGFNDNCLNDAFLANHSLLKYTNTDENKLAWQTKIPKPIDDIVDSYFIVNSIRLKLD